MTDWELEFNKSKQRFNSVWSLNMHNIITRNEFDQRMKEINSIVSQNPCPRPYIVHCFTFLSGILLIGGSILIAIGFISNPYYLSATLAISPIYLAFAIILYVCGIASLFLMYFIHEHMRKKFESAVISYLNQLNEIYNPRINWILHNTSIKIEGRINIGSRHEYKLIIQTSAQVTPVYHPTFEPSNPNPGFGVPSNLSTSLKVPSTQLRGSFEPQGFELQGLPSERVEFPLK